MIAIISAPGGAGKSTIISRLLAADPKLHFSRSWTTRPRRPSEPEDWYHFADRASFEARRDAGGFVEWAEVAGNLYGTPTLDAPPGKDLLLEIDVQGARHILAEHPEAIVILVVPPSREVQRARLEARGDPPEVIALRMAISDEEETAGRALARHVVVNDDLDGAVTRVAGILSGYRPKAVTDSDTGLP